MNTSQAVEYILTEGTDAQGRTLWTARHVSGQPIDWSADKAAMQARVDQLNAGRPYSEFTAERRPAEHRAQTRVNPATSCHFCGLDARTCDCN